MIKSLTTIIAVVLTSSIAFAVDIFEVRNLGEKSLENGKAVLVSLMKLPKSELYTGSRISVSKEKGKIIGETNIVYFEGFLELDDGKLSPVTTHKIVKFEIQKPGGEWIQVKVEGEEKVQFEVRWIQK